MQRVEIRLSGSGGQGMILAGVILAEAIGINDGKIVVQTQSYGPEARGGASRSDVVISDGEIDYPKSLRIDVLLCLTQQSYESYQSLVKPGGLLIYDSDWVELKEEKADCELLGLPILKVAREVVGREIVANIVSLGVIAEKTGLVSKEGLEKAVLGRVPKGTESINLRALRSGYDLAQGAQNL